MSGNRISNGGFNGDAANWTLGSSAAFIASQGKKELGAVHLAGAGDFLEQSFTVPVGRDQMIDVWVKSVSGAGNLSLTITNSAGDTVHTATLSVTASWANALSSRTGLPEGNFTFKLAYSDVACYVDDISLAWVIKTRAELAAWVHDLLGNLASDSTDGPGYSTAASGSDTEGDYTEAVDYGLRQVGAVDERGEPDVRCLDEDNLDICIDEIQKYMLHKLHRYYALKATDFTLEGRTERYNQRVKAIENLLGIAVGGRPSASGRGVQTRKLIHQGVLG